MIVLEKGRLVRGEVDAPGQQRLVVFEARCFGQRGEQRARVLVGFDAVGLGGLCRPPNYAERARFPQDSE